MEKISDGENVQDTIFFAQELKFLVSEIEAGIGDIIKLDTVIEVLPPEASNRPMECMVMDDSMVEVTKRGELKPIAFGKTKLTVLCDYGTATCMLDVSETGKFIPSRREKADEEKLSVEGFEIGGRAKDALRVNWKKNVFADGYIIEQFEDGKWVRIARIADSATTTFRVEHLGLSTVYKFRIKAFRFDKGVPVYSDYVYVKGKTLPDKKIENTSTEKKQGETNMIEGVKKVPNGIPAVNIREVKSQEGFIELRWDELPGVEGYLIYKKSEGKKWERLSYLSGDSSIFYWDERVEKGMYYEYLVIAYKDKKVGAYGTKGKGCTYE